MSARVGNQILALPDGTITGAKLATGAITPANLQDGALIDFAYAHYTGVETSPLTFPLDDTIPAWDEGFQPTGFQVSITPKAATNLLRVSVVVNIGCTAASKMACALYRDASGTDAAIAVSHTDLDSANHEECIALTFTVVAGSVSPTIFQVRVGANSGTVYLNSNASGSRIYGGGSVCALTVTEIKAS